MSPDGQGAAAAETEEFMSVAAHDLRNPIAVVRASAQMAQRQIGRGDDAGAQTRLRAIVEQTDRLTDMLETFLDAARIDAGRLVLRKEQVDARSLVEDAATHARAGLGDPTGREIVIAVPAECSGMWDRVRIARAVRALILNALIYGDPSAPVQIGAEARNGHIAISVSGGGPGPDPEEQQHLFKRFFRGRSAAESGQSGSGLGLFTARGIARLHGGDVRRIDADQFVLELPLGSPH